MLVVHKSFVRFKHPLWLMMTYVKFSILLQYLFVVNFTISLPIMASGFGIRALALKKVKKSMKKGVSKNKNSSLTPIINVII